jgi:hypothetical protein
MRAMGDGRSYAAAVARRPFPALKSADSPSPPKPTSISAQVEGSGTPEFTIKSNSSYPPP